MSKAHVGFKVRQHNPFRLWIGIVLLVFLLIIMFLMGRAYQSYELSQAKLVQETLEVRIDELEQRNTSLVKKNAQLDGASKIEHDAYEESKQAQVALQKEILGLKEQLVFYQGIVSPEQLTLGVNIQSFELGKKNDLGLYSYKLVLSKRGKSSQYIKGTFELTLKGQQQDKQKDLAVSKIKQDFKDKDLKFSFRYFQVFEGDLMLPEGFQPYEIDLKIKPKSRKIKNFSEAISWEQALSGGND